MGSMMHKLSTDKRQCKEASNQNFSQVRIAKTRMCKTKPSGGETIPSNVHTVILISYANCLAHDQCLDLPNVRSTTNAKRVENNVRQSVFLKAAPFPSD
jgi:hypothetical protein